MAGFAEAVRLVPAAYLVHVAEEAPGFVGWTRRHGSREYGRSDFALINGAGLALTLAATRLVSRRPTRPIVFLYFAHVLTQQAVFNAAFHLGTTIAYREYSPGVLTATLAFPALWWRLTRLARSEGLLSRAGAVGAAAIGGAVHAKAVASQVYGR